jgi:predicted HTH transcriptional regulator
MKHIFISSAQKEFAAERTALRDYLRADPLLRRFFEVFLFEDLPAAGRRADAVYLKEVEACDLYIGLFGKENSLPTEQEFNHASELGKPRLIYVKGADDPDKHPKMRTLIKRAGSELIRRRFVDSSSLLPAVYASLVSYLEENKLILNGPFDAAPCRKATLKDLSSAGMKAFIRDARASRGFPLKESASGKELLTHLNLLEGEQPTHAAVLLFGKEPQRFLSASEIKCAHFHGTEVAKPIPSYQVYKGTVFSLVDQAVDFVMSKLALSVGTRAKSTQVPVAYEIPREVVSEGIVNAVAHRDYTSNGSVQVMLFADRLEIWNPGGLPSSLTLARLRQAHGSVPHNPLLAEPLYLTKYIERMGTGTRDMIRRCRDAGLSEPEFRITDGFTLTIPRLPGAKTSVKSSPNGSPKSSPKSSPKTEDKIIELIKKEPGISTARMGKILRISKRAVIKQTNKLQVTGILQHVGPAKGGHWEVLK